jgi:hypothetical protein
MRRLRCSEPRDGLIELNEPRVYDAYFVTVKALDPELSPGRGCRPRDVAQSTPFAAASQYRASRISQSRSAEGPSHSARNRASMASSMRRALSALKIVSGVFNFMVDVPQIPRPSFPLSLIGDGSVQFVTGAV